MSPSDPSQPEQEYDEELTALLETVWGEGFMSPGGTQEVDRVLDGLDLEGRRVLDIGCGLGGATVHIAREYGVEEIVGIDIEDMLVSRCRDLAARAGVADVARFQRVEPGPLPFGDASFDLVFSKDSIIHIADKHGLARDVFRCLRPGGVFAASDWLAGYDDAPSPAMRAYVEAEGLDFGLASAAVYEAALTGAGFEDVAVVDRNAWYRDEARRERDAMKGALYANLATSVGKAFLDRQVDVWEKMVVALDEGQLRPTHLRARKPATS